MRRIKRLLLAAVASLILGCSQGPGVNLALKASLIKKGVSEEADVVRELGPPQQELVEAGRRVWVYWNRRPTGLPFKKETEVLRVVFEKGKVKEVVYYVLEE